MREEILEQHRRLDGLLGGVRAALARTLPEVGHALAELEEALAAHFEQEDRLYYPPIGSLRPEHRASVQRFASDHRRFLDRLEALADRIRRQAVAEAAREFETFAADFVGHEAGEEALLAALQAEVEAAR